MHITAEQHIFFTDLYIYIYIYILDNQHLYCTIHATIAYYRRRLSIYIDVIGVSTVDTIA